MIKLCDNVQFFMRKEMQPSLEFFLTSFWSKNEANMFSLKLNNWHLGKYITLNL